MASSHHIQSLIEPVIQSLGYRVWGVDYLPSQRGRLRVFIDKEGGINVDDCAAVSRQISSVLDVEDPIIGEYTLEVSSPGMDCTLFTTEQYQLFIGSMVSIRLRIPLDGRKNYKGILTDIKNDEAFMLIDDHIYTLPIESIEKAHVIPPKTLSANEKRSS